MARYKKVCECGISITTKKEKELMKLFTKHVAKSHVEKVEKVEQVEKIKVRKNVKDRNEDIVN